GHVWSVVSHNTARYFELRADDNRWAEDNDGRNWDFRSATLPVYLVVTALGLAGLVLAGRDRRLWPLYLIVGQFMALSLVLVAPPRLRLPFDVLCCIGVGLLVGARRSRARSGQDSTEPMSHAAP